MPENDLWYIASVSINRAIGILNALAFPRDFHKPEASEVLAAIDELQTLHDKIKEATQNGN
jgi:hypothetical protein